MGPINSWNFYWVTSYISACAKERKSFSTGVPQIFVGVRYHQNAYFLSNSDGFSDLAQTKELGISLIFARLLITEWKR